MSKFRLEYNNQSIDPRVCAIESLDREETKETLLL